MLATVIFNARLDAIVVEPAYPISRAAAFLAPAVSVAVFPGVHQVICRRKARGAAHDPG
jgi:hypothetical protein